jgi:hypothetical protein
MYHLSLWDPNRSHEPDRGITQESLPDDTTEEAALKALHHAVDSGKAQLGQLLAGDGLVLKNYARPVN